METKIFILLFLAVCAGHGRGSRLPDCIGLANSVHAYLAHAQSQDPYTNISQEIEFASSLDTTNLTALRRIACAIEGRPASAITKYFVHSGVARYMVRRMYGYGIFFYRLFKQQLADGTIGEPVDPGIAQLKRLGLRAIDAFEDRGFLCFDSPSVAEAKEKFSRIGLRYRRPGEEPSCDVFDEIAEELLELLEEHFSEYLVYITQTSGLHVADTENIGQFLCDLAGKDSFEGIVDVLSTYGVFDHLILAGLRTIPQILGPITEFEETLSLTDDELKERFPHLRGSSEGVIASFREGRRLAVNLHRNLKKLADSITMAHSEWELSSI